MLRVAALRHNEVINIFRYNDIQEAQAHFITGAFGEAEAFKEIPPQLHGEVAIEWWTDGDNWYPPDPPYTPDREYISITQANSIMTMINLGIEIPVELHAQAQETLIFSSGIPFDPEDNKEWRPNIIAKGLTKKEWRGDMWLVLHTHLTQAGWEPHTTPSLFVKVQRDWDEWVQPLGGHDAYYYGARVTHNGVRWVSIHPANVWPPGVHGWVRWEEN